MPTTAVVARVAGSPTLIPVLVRSAGAAVTAQLEGDASPRPAPLVRIAPAPGEPDRWLDARVWVAETLDDANPAQAGEVVFARLDEGASDEGATRVRIGGERVTLLPPATLPADGAEAGELPSSLSLVAPAAGDPFQHWRVRLLLRRTGRPESDAGIFSDPNLLALARQREALWSAALDRLARTDADVAEDLLRHLTRVVAFPRGSLAPAWRDFPGLPESVLAQDADLRRLAQQLRTGLDAMPRAAAWVVDDSGNALGSAVGVAELLGEATLAVARPDNADGCDPVALEALRANTATLLHLRCRFDPPERTIEVEVDHWQARLGVLATEITASPPGVRIGPLRREYTMRQWLAGEQPEEPPGGRTIALLQPAAGGGWEVYIEAQAALDDAQREESSDTVDLFFGPTTNPRAVRTIEAPPPSDSRREADRWTAFVPVPVEAFEPDGSLLLAIRRIDGAGRVSSWPRPMLPFQSEPGRARIGLDSWDAAPREQFLPAR